MTLRAGLMRPIRAAVGSARRHDSAPAADLAAADLAAAEIPEPTTIEELAALVAQPGFADIEAAVALVEAGLATRVVLANFASWPGLLWQTYQLADAADVTIVPIAVHPGGRVDIAVTRALRADD